MTRSLAVLLLVLAGCSVTRTTTVEFLIPLAYHPPPSNWTPPPKYLHCQILDEVVLEDGTPDGLPTVRVQCPNDGPMIWFDKATKRIVQIRRWDE